MLWTWEEWCPLHPSEGAPPTSGHHLRTPWMLRYVDCCLLYRGACVRVRACMCACVCVSHSSPPPQGPEGYHTYLILSQADSTMVLQTGQEITELDTSGFATQAPTVFAGNMMKGRYIVQVSCSGCGLLRWMGVAWCTV